MAKSARKSNFEILRIVSMLFIVSFHCVYKAQWDMSTIAINNRIVIDAFMMLGEIGVNLFVLLSGYFLIKNEFSWIKMLLLLVEVAFYNYLSLLILSDFNVVSFISLVSIKDLFPTVFTAYWFATAYALLYLFSPFISKALLLIDRNDWQKLIITGIIVYCVIPTILMFFDSSNKVEGYVFYNRFIWMVLVFSIGGYIRVHGDNVKALNHNPRVYILVYFAILAIEILFIFFVEDHTGAISSLGIQSPTLFWPPNTIPTLISSIILFLFFSKLRIPEIKIVNKIAAGVFGVYLLHDGKLQGTIWSIVSIVQYSNDSLLIMYIALFSFSILAVGVAIDSLRQIPEKLLKLGLKSLQQHFNRTT